MNSFPSSQDINKRNVFFLIAILVLVLVVVYVEDVIVVAVDDCDADLIAIGLSPGNCDGGGAGMPRPTPIDSPSLESTSNQQITGLAVGLTECSSDFGCGDCGYCDNGKCVSSCSAGQVCYNGACCTPPSCAGRECGTVSACGETIYCGGCPPYKECDGDILKEYSAGNCFSKTCSYFPPKETNCNNLDGWYCNGNTREYRDYYCDDSERDCKYRVDESYNCKERYGINYMCNDTIRDCQCVPEDKEEVGAECGPDGCNPTGFGFCSYTQECIGNSCLDKKDPKTIVGYLEITGVNDKELKANLLPSDYNQKATASAYCSKFNELFQDNSCQNEEYDECGWIPGNDDVVMFYINNYELNDQSITVTCNQKGIIDGSCDGTKDFEVKFTLCDRNSDVDCVPGDYYIDVSKLGLDLDCVYVDEIEKGFESGYCHSNNELVLRAINNYKPCDPEDSNKVCIMGRCTYYNCEHNGEIDPYESCDPIDPNLYNVSGTIYSQEDMSCAYLWMKPIDTGSTPSCSKTCIINTSNCGELSEYCYNHKIEDKTEYKEVCDFLEEPEYLRTLSNENIEIDSIFSGKHYCAEKEGYIGDASKLKCVGCLGISYENCDEEAKDETEKREQNCNDNLNEDYWYDLYVPVGNDRTQYIADNYLDENGYFSDFKFDTSQCYNETTCYDCYDKDCDGKTHYGYTCNFKHERFCNDGFDNDGDGLIDSKDPDCSYEKYNPEFSKKGYCDSEDKCFLDESLLDCIDSTNIKNVNEKKVICNQGTWTSPIKLEANLFYSKATDKNDFIIYCNNFGDLTKEKGYVISLEGKAGNPYTDTKEFLESFQSYFGKFCALKTPKEYALSTRFKSWNIPALFSIFSNQTDICTGINNENNNNLSKCTPSSNIYINKKLGIVLKTDLNFDGFDLFSVTNNIDEKIAKSVNLLNQVFPITREHKELIKDGALTEALVWKKDNNKELFGFIETINKTTYTVLTLKNIDFDDLCKKINNQQTITIHESLKGRCAKPDENTYVIYWIIYPEMPERESLIKESLYQFDNLVKQTRI